MKQGWCTSSMLKTRFLDGTKRTAWPEDILVSIAPTLWGDHQGPYLCVTFYSGRHNYDKFLLYLETIIFQNFQLSVKFDEE